MDATSNKPLSAACKGCGTFSSRAADESILRVYFWVGLATSYRIHWQSPIRGAKRQTRLAGRHATPPVHEIFWKNKRPVRAGAARRIAAWIGNAHDNQTRHAGSISPRNRPAPALATNHNLPSLAVKCCRILSSSRPAPAPFFFAPSPSRQCTVAQPVPAHSIHGATWWKDFYAWLGQTDLSRRRPARSRN